MDYMATPGTVIPLIIVLLLVIYYLASLTSALREANIDLKIQLRRERTEERKKMFQMASRRKRGGSDLDSTFAKWKKILQEVPSMKMSEDSPFPDYLDDHKRDDTDIDNGFLKHDEEDTEKERKMFKAKQKTESTAEKNWGTLMKKVPPTESETKVKDSSSTTSSVKDDSSLPSEGIPEIKISRVQTRENILKSDGKEEPRKCSKTSERDKTTEEPKPEMRQAVLEKWQQKQQKMIGKSAFETITTGSDTGPTDLDDVFLESGVVEVPELPKIQESISNRIKRRLRKVISRGSSGENQFCMDIERRDTDRTRTDSQGTEKVDMKEPQKKADDELPEASRASCIPEVTHPSRLIKSESWNAKRDVKLKPRIETRRRSSLDDISAHFYQ